MRRFRLSTLLPGGAVALTVLLAACQPAPSDEPAAPADPAGPASPETLAPLDAGGAPIGVDPEAWPAVSSPFAEDPALEARIADLLSRMSLEEKVGQVIQADIGSVTPEEVRDYNLGSVLNGGNSAPGDDNYAPPDAWLELADEFHAASIDTRDGGVGVPVMWGTDAVHGHNNVVGATIFPHNIGLGAAGNPDLIRRIGEVTATEVRVTGQDWTFAPTLAVVRDDRWGRTYESYSEDPEIVAAYAGQMVIGLQGEHGSEDFLAETRVLATPKHFLGDGGTQGGIDQGDNRYAETDLARIHGAGYPPAIEAGALSVMASFNSWNGEKLHGHRGLLTDILVGRLGFNGFVVGDWDGHGQVEGCTSESCPQSFAAGVDMFMAPGSWRELYVNLLGQVRRGEVSMERLDEAVLRILRVKARMGLLDAPRPSQRPLAGEFERLGSPEHRAVARAAVRQSLVLLKNEGGVLPIRGDASVLVTGPQADDIGFASGGWTINWQGEGNANEDFPGGQSILAGIREAVAEGGGEVIYSPDGEIRSRPDVAIVVFGEQPYAEFQGDLHHLDFAPEGGLRVLRSLREQGVPTVAVFLSGRPLWMNPEINASDAFVAAWLPGVEGGGVADVLIGDAEGAPRHDFRGRLTFSWPSRPDQTPLNLGDEVYEPLFAYGYGGRYADPPVSFAELDESVAVHGRAQTEFALVNAGRAAPGHELILLAADDEPVLVSGPFSALETGALEAAAEDRNAQEDTRRFTWNAPARLRMQAPAEAGWPLRGDGLALSISYLVDSAPDEDVIWRMSCGPECAGELAIGQGVRIANGKGWREALVPLDCFGLAGGDDGEAAMADGLEILSAAGLSMIIADVRIVSADTPADCEF